MAAQKIPMKSPHPVLSIATMRASSLQQAHKAFVLAQMLPGNALSVVQAVNLICKQLNAGVLPDLALSNALENVGLRFARQVPGLVMGRREARLYVQPRKLLAAYPELAQSMPRPYDYALILDEDDLVELQHAPAWLSASDLAENNEIESLRSFSGSGGFWGDIEVACDAQSFEGTVLIQVLTPSALTVSEALGFLCDGLSKTGHRSDEDCNALNMELEDVGLRFHMVDNSIDKELGCDGFLLVTNSRQLIRSYPGLKSVLPALPLCRPIRSISAKMLNRV